MCCLTFYVLRFSLAEESTERSPLCFTRIKQKALRDYEERTMSGVDVQICLHTCLNTSSFYCASVNYDELGHICTLNGGSVYFNNAELKNSTSDYYENECNHVRDSQRIVSSTATLGSRAIVPTGCFEIMANSVLLSFDGKLVENAVSLDECQAACTLSNRQCGALNWIPNRNGCMLFGIGYDTKSVVFSSNAQFLIHKCAGK
uniref:PAN domain protein n=1 Tax=Angiostrongylus cantonensis TaxID=6313 RepID=A0A0K0D1B4_ANGCA